MTTIAQIETVKVTGNFDSDISGTVAGASDVHTILNKTPTNRMCKGTLYIYLKNNGSPARATVTLDNTIVLYLSTDMTQHPYTTGTEIRETLTDFVMGPDQELKITITGAGNDYYAGYSGVYLTNSK